ncbi:glycogen debranching protein GlgX [Pararhizobium sp.]|uniref:glycogen debranching protein GlgX n=1 Tax=Pararhizobium sp. TaxID=1977563 RepID=UPI0027190207|nr:glycogen debranching protein GlgX [Pararhizobium sp.]MDO9415217.1 glycogen debranching protein GlgX [Pararhizobium sp.]
MAPDEKLAPYGATPTPEGVRFSVWSHHASSIELCLYDSAGKRETRRIPMNRLTGDIHSLFVPGLKPGARYGLRADGVYSPDHGLWFDPSKLLVDPYATELDRPFVYDPKLGVFGEDTAKLVPKAIVGQHPLSEPEAPLFTAGGLIYEVAVKPFTMLNKAVPEKQRGTVAALAHPSVIAHLKRIGVSAVELMPVTAWIDERHLPPLGLSNGWGYNPVAMMALDPRLVPGGVRELKETVAALRAEGIGVILDLVFNHTGESDRYGATLSMRGIDNLTYYRHVTGLQGDLINDTGCGNTLACDHPSVHDLVLDSLRHFVLTTGVDGFRFDLAPIIARNMSGFHRDAPLLTAMLTDPVLKDRVLIAEPWDIGPGGYQLGNFPIPFLEWNDRARDDMRMFWRGDRHKIGALATGLSGSSDLFSRYGETGTRTINFVAAHDGFTLMDLVSNTGKHNEANGEENRDGHNDNHSWNNGAEGDTDDAHIIAARKRDVMAILGTLFSARGTIMLTAGDEGGRSQKGNNNAYAQDNPITWVDWDALDDTLIAHTAAISAIRRRFDVFSQAEFLTGDGDVEWLKLDGWPMSVWDWDNPATDNFMMVLATGDRETGLTTRIAILFNRAHADCPFRLPEDPVKHWQGLLSGTRTVSGFIPARSVDLFVEIS